MPAAAHSRSLLLVLALTGCDDATKDESPAQAKPAEASKTKGTADKPTKSADAPKASPDADAAPEKPKKNKDADKGSAKLKLGDADWTAERASARIKDGKKLRITASRTTRVDGKINSQRLTLSVGDYNGPGDYVIEGYASSFAGAGVATADVKAAEKDDAKTTKVATEAIKGGSVSLLTGAKVEIESATAEFIDGSFSWSGATVSKGPKNISGTFHARIKE